jgi:spermidine/putrescine transport system permease protein
MNFLRRVIVEEFSFLFACPTVLWQLFFLYLPLVALLAYSFYDPPVFTFKYYFQAFSPVYLAIIGHSLIVAIATAFSCFLIAYPVSYFLVIKVHKRFKTILLFSLILPSWTNLIVQIYAWFFLFDKNSFLSQLFYHLGILSKSTHLLNNYFSILIVMVAIYLPFMILPIYTSLEKIDKRLLEASADLGSSRFQTFKRVVFPLSLPGVYAGLLLVFLPAFGEFVIPTLLGGSKIIFWGNLIVDKFLISRNWQSGAAAAMVGIMFSGLIIVVGYLIIRFFMCVRRFSNKTGRVL